MFQPKRRIIIVGKTGTGKSSTGNTILGRTSFTTEDISLVPVTDTCLMAYNFRDDQHIEYAVVDTPGLFDTQHPFAETALKIQKSLHLCRKPHVILFVLKASDRFKEEDLLTIDMMRVIFGEEFLKYTIVVFTEGNRFSSDEVFEKCWAKSESAVTLIKACGNRVTRIENSCSSYPTNGKLLKMIEELSCDGTKFYNYGSIQIHQAILKEYLKRTPERARLQDELQILVGEISKKINREKWTNRLLGGGAFIVGGATIGVVVALIGPSAAAAWAATVLAGVAERAKRF